MKQGLNLLLLVSIGMDLDEVENIEFIFKDRITSAPTAVKKIVTYPNECDRVEDTDVIAVPWTEEETYLFAPGKPFYMDTRITINGTAHQPETDIVELYMKPTLFEREG